MSHPCELCGAEKADKYSAFELESWGFVPPGEKKDFYYLCFPCFDKLSDVYSEEVLERLKVNREELEKLISEGKVCPHCKTLILETPHTCEP